MFKRCPLCFLSGYRDCPDPGVTWALLGILVGILIFGAVVIATFS